MKKTDREKIRMKYDNHCAYCGEILGSKFHVDHIFPIKRISKWDLKTRKWIQSKESQNPELDTLENCNPSCASCNINKSDRTLEQFRHFIKNFIVSLNRDSTQYKIAKRYGLIEETQKPVKFYYEK